MAGLPGVKVGPLDPDTTKDFGEVSAQMNARTLIRLHAQMHPPALTQALARPRDDERTKGLDLEEVAGYVGRLKLEESGDPMLPEGSRIVGAAVRGERDRPQVVTFEFELPKSGRTGKWYAPYNEDVLPDSFAAGAEFVKVKEMKDRGVVAYDEGGARLQQLERELGHQRRENDALRNIIQAGHVEDVKLPESTERSDVDTRPSETLAADNQALRQELEELRAFKAQHDEDEAERAREAAEERQRAAGESPDARPDAKAPASAEDPPFEGYDDLKAEDLIKRLRDEETSAEEKQAIVDYERRHADRRTVVAAGEESLGRSGTG